MSIFGRLEYNFETTSNSVFELSSNTQNFMNTVPSLLTDWQQNDIANNEVGGYFRNPVANVAQDIRDTCNTIFSILIEDATTNTNSLIGETLDVTNLFITMNIQTANIGTNNGGLFIEHTNRISGVTSIQDSLNIDDKNALLPHYQTAMSTGQLLMYLTNQAESVSNNTPIMGNFTSILIEEELNSLYSNISTYATQINNSITITGTGISPDNFVRTSNLSLETVQSMANNIDTINTTLSVRRNHDEKFYTNSKQIVEEYSQLRIFNTPGATANNLMQNYIGSDKLLTRLNS